MQDKLLNQIQWLKGVQKVVLVFLFHLFQTLDKNLSKLELDILGTEWTHLYLR